MDTGISVSLVFKTLSRSSFMTWSRIGRTNSWTHDRVFVNILYDARSCPADSPSLLWWSWWSSFMWWGPVRLVWLSLVEVAWWIVSLASTTIISASSWSIIIIMPKHWWMIPKLYNSIAAWYSTSCWCCSDRASSSSFSSGRVHRTWKSSIVMG